MSDLSSDLPIIDQMHAATSRAAQARILLACPLLILNEHRNDFYAALAVSKFEDGAEYLLMQLAALTKTRTPYGTHQSDWLNNLEKCRQTMLDHAEISKLNEGKAQ